MAKSQDGLKVRGMLRVQIIDDPDGTPKVVGDSGWRKNLVTNLGFNNAMIQNIGTGLTGTKISHMAIGTGGAPVVTDTTLAGEQSVREAITAATSSGSKTLRCTATFASQDSFVTATKNISNIGLFGTSTAAGGTLFAGTTYTSSACATNQNVNVTYDLVFATA